jgi:MFS family permease
VSDRAFLCAAAFLRATAVGMISVLLGIHLAVAGLDAERIGLVVAAGLGGSAVAALVVTLAGDRMGRRNCLVAIALLGAAGAFAFCAQSGAPALAAAAFVGMINGMGRDRGPSLILETAMLPATVSERGRTGAFAWYALSQDAGHALGALLAGLPGLLQGSAGMSPLGSSRAAIAVYGCILLLMGVPYLAMSRRLETQPGAPRGRLSPAAKRVIGRLAALFALDGLGSGFLTTALLSYYFFERFGAGSGEIAALFFGARVLNALSHLAAARIAARFGLINTMVFTHIPSSLLLVTVAVAPSFPVAAVLFLLREGLVEMDVPTRQSYVMAVVAPGERTAASGATHLARLVVWAVGPAMAGLVTERAGLWVPLVAGACIKIAYDVLLYAAFRGLPPPEERAGDASGR